MADYVLYDGSGVIQRTLRLVYIDATTFLAANTPAGLTSLQADASAAIGQPDNYTVTGGVLTLK